MRPIEDTITALEICWGMRSGSCGDCPYFGDDCRHSNAERIDALTYLRIADIALMPEWHRLAEQQPPHDGTYLTFTRYRDGSTDQKLKLWHNGAFTSEPKQVLYWRPLPPDPEER